MTRDFNFVELFLSHSRDKPRRTALVEPGRGRKRAKWNACSFERLASRSIAFADGLTGAGVERGDRVLVMLRPSIASTAVFFGLMRMGAIPVLMDPRMGLSNLLRCILLIEPDVVIAIPAFHALLTASRRAPESIGLRITDGRRWFWRGPRLRFCESSGGTEGAREPSGGTERPREPTSGGDVCFIPFTSGSTGRAKAVVLTHAMLGNQARLLVDATGWQEDDTVVMCFPGFVPLTLACGLTTVLPDMDFSRPAAADPARIVEAIGGHGAECAFAAPALWAKIATYCRDSGVRLEMLRHPVTAGAPVPIDLHLRLAPVIHRDGRLQTPYGATEALPITSTVTTDLSRTWDSTRRGYGLCVGRPVPGVDVTSIRITDAPIPEWSEDLAVPVGEIGELVVRGPVVSEEYRCDPSANESAKIRRDGHHVHRMGDLGRVDAEGRVWYCGRLSQRVRTRDGMIAPVQVESLLDQHPGVRRTALVGVGPSGRERAVICVELEQGRRLSAQVRQELQELLRDTPWAHSIDTYLAHPRFPVDPRHNSKIRREELAAWAAARLGSAATAGSGRTAERS